MQRTGMIHFPNYINTCAAYIGKLRDLVNYEMNEKAERFKRGGRSEYVNILGVKGELIFSHHLHAQNVEHVVNSLLENSPINSWDIKIKDNFFIDVKTIRTDAPDLLVNESAHKKDKGITHYVFIQLLEQTKARYWVYSKSEVDQWEIKNCKYSNAYFKPITEIKKMRA